ncbi:MAG: PBECR2 nuclease fold domain-containing protein [Nanoarchaeota archaeon]
MDFVFEFKDKTGRNIYLTKKQWAHITSPISLHAYMTNYLEEMKETLHKPDKILSSVYDKNKVSYYRFYKNRKEYLRVIVNYLNGYGFVITSYFVRNII